MMSTDWYALLVLFRSTGGAKWTRKGNWDTATDIADWEGVEVDAHGRVMELSLPKNNLRGKIPDELGSLHAMQKLDLSSNFLTGHIPKELGALIKMQRLDLCNNKLAGGIPKELGALTKMQELYLFSNNLTGGIPKELGALTEMQELYLSRNKLTGGVPKALGALTKMQKLVLSKNKLTGGIPKELAALTEMQELGLSSNKLIGGIPKELAALTEMQRLYLFSNKLTGSIPKEIGALTGMQVLDLRYNRLTGRIPKELGALTEMQELCLDGNKLTGPRPPESFGGDMRDWVASPEEEDKLKARGGTEGKYCGADRPLIVRLLDVVTDCWHVCLPVFDDATDVYLLTSTAGQTNPFFWWTCVIALVVADVERLWFLCTLCLTTGLLPLLLCLDAAHFIIRPRSISYYFGRSATHLFARLNCTDDAPQNTIGGRLLDSVLWVLFGSRSRCSPMWGLAGMGLNTNVKEAHRAGVGFGAIDRWVDCHPFRVLGKCLFGGGFGLKGGNEGVSRRAGVMIRAVGETLVVDSLFLAFSVTSGGWDGDLTGAAGISAIFSILELVTELQYYITEAGALLEPVPKPEQSIAADPPAAGPTAVDNV